MPVEQQSEDAQRDADYNEGWRAGMDNTGVWGGESKVWLSGFTDATFFRIAAEQAHTDANP